MGDAMREKVARAMFRQDHDEGWDQGEVRTKVIYLNNAEAALEACCFEELVEALKPFADCADFIGTHSRHMKDETGLWTPFSSRGEQPPCILVSHVRAARAVLAKVKEAGHA